jgi:hypothetical protein
MDSRSRIKYGTSFAGMTANGWLFSQESCSMVYVSAYHKKPDILLATAVEKPYNNTSVFCEAISRQL